MMTGFAPLHPYLLAQRAENRLSHAYIFSGAGGEEQARALCAALLCQSPGADSQACGVCPACCNLAAGTYPDCHILDPVGSAHKVEAMRSLVAMAGLTPMSGTHKCFVLRQAERMSDEGANTLLKLLEEPAPDVTLILLTAAPEALLPTVLSRCQLFVFGAAAAEEPEIEQDLLLSAERMLKELPQTPLYQVLLQAREFDKDRAKQRLFFFALLKCLHRALKGECELPMSGSALLRSANMCESAVAMLGPASISHIAEPVARNVNQKLLTDVVYLRLWQNTQR